MMEVEKLGRGHFVFRSNEPCRLEVTANGMLIAFGYKGTKDNRHQEPEVIYEDER